MSQLPALDGLATFDAVARHLSFSRAAKDLHVTQSAVSHRIRSLEEELGVQLFLRTARKVQLTDAGHVLARATAEGFDRLKQGFAEIASLKGGGLLTVSCCPSFAIRWLVPHLTNLRARSPDIDVRVAAEDRLVEPGVNGIDACIRYGPGEYRGVEAIRLGVERVTPVCSPRRLQLTPLEKPEDLCEHVLLHDEVLHEHPGYVGWSTWLEAAGVARSESKGSLRFSHSYMALEAAVAGQGVALARPTLLERDLREGRLVAPFEIAVESGLSYWLLTARSKARRSEVETFIHWLSESVESGSA